MIDGALLAALPTFRAVAETGGFTAAAGRLGVSPSAVSQAIRQLERRLDVRLFQRSSRSVRLTVAGERLLQETASGLDRLGVLIDELRVARGRPGGTLRLTLSRLAAEVCVQPRLVEFVRNWPEICLELFVDDRLNDIVAGGFDAGIRLGSSLAQDMVALPIGPRLRRSLIASPAYLARHGVPQRLEDLDGHRALRFRFPDSGQLEPWLFRRAGETVSMSPPPVMVLLDNAHFRQVTLAGLGIGQRFRATEAERLASGELVSVLDAFEPEPRQFYLYYPSRALMPRTLRVFIEHFCAVPQPAVA